MCFFNRRTPENLSKIDYWKKYDFFELIADLHQALEFLANYSGGYSNGFLSAEAFYLALEDAIDDIEFGNQTDLNRFYIWFAPASDWDDFTGNEGSDLGDNIFERVKKWKEAIEV
jgi:hypothetical protein